MPINEQLFNQAKAFQQKSQFAEALAIFRELVQKNPRSAVLLFELGNTFNCLLDSRQALDCYLRALEIDAHFPGLKNNLGNTWLNLNEPAKALQCFEDILARHPQDVNALNNRGTALRDLRQPELALACYEKALAVAPNHLEALNNHGNQLLELNQPEKALHSYQHAYKLAPQFPPTFRNAGRALLAMHQTGEALKLFDIALQLQPQDAFSWMYRGDTLRQLQRFEDAIASYEQALRLHPDLDFLPGLKLYLQMQICDWRDWHAQMEQLKTAILAHKRHTVPMPMLGLVDNPSLQKTSAQIYLSHQAPARLAEASVAFAHNKKRDGESSKIKIAYLSAHFHEHPTGKLMAEVFEHHDRNQFEWIAFSFGIPSLDAVRQRLVPAFDQFIDVRFKSDAQIVELARHIGVDIAVDLTGYYDQSRPGIFARRAAPIQVSYLVTPGTLGMPYFDYLIADPIVVPQESFEHFSEHIVHLPRSYFTFDSTQKISQRCFTRQALGLPEQAFVFCCFNNSYKITPPTFDVWMRILQQCPASVLWLLESNALVIGHLRREASLRGIDPERLIFSKVAPIDEHLARQQLADLFLDTWPCNAHTTACDALYSGLPVLTFAGQSFASRVAASLLTALNLPELITDSPQAYEHKALELAQQPAQLQGFRERLKASRSLNPLFQGEAKARELEAAYQSMMQRYRDGLAPTHFSVTV